MDQNFQPNSMKIYFYRHQCIPRSNVCDGVKDCIEYGLDELPKFCEISWGCASSMLEWSCPVVQEPSHRKVCLKRSKVCDHIGNCPNGEDELNCQGGSKKLVCNPLEVQVEINCPIVLEKCNKYFDNSVREVRNNAFLFGVSAMVFPIVNTGKTNIMLHFAQKSLTKSE